MTGTELIALANSLLDDDDRIGSDLGLLLANHIKDLIEAERAWNFLIKRDVSISITSSTTWETENDLPSDFEYEKNIGILDSSNNFGEVFPTKFENREFHKDSNRYCIDMANSKIYFLDSFGASYTAVIYYIYKTDDLTASTEPVWSSRFHKIISFLMAEIHGSGIDYDEIEVNKAIAQNKQASLLFESMKAMDTKQSLNAIGHSTPSLGGGSPYRTNRIPMR